MRVVSHAADYDRPCRTASNHGHRARHPWFLPRNLLSRRGVALPLLQPLAPVFTATGEVTFYLPPGTWTHLLTGERVAGGFSNYVGGFCTESIMDDLRAAASEMSARRAAEAEPRPVPGASFAPR